MTETPTALRPRFSLRTLLTLTAWLAMGITIYLQWRELAPLRTEVKKLRDETGKLWVEDETKVHILQVDTGDDLTYKWRIWLPMNQKFVVRNEGGQIPEHGLPPHGGMQYVEEGGEHVIVFQVRKDQRDDKWHGCCLLDDVGVVIYEQPWAEWKDVEWKRVTIDKHTQVLDPTKPAVVAREIYWQRSGGKKIESTASGFMIWIEPAK